MPQPPDPTPSADAPDAPPTERTCGFCHKPIAGAYYHAAGRITCPPCAGQLHGFIRHNRFSFSFWMAGMGFGLAAALVGAFLWALITKWTNAEWGLVAVLIAIAVSKAVIYGAGNRRGPDIQVLTIGLSMLGIFVGKGLIAAWVLWPQLVAQEGVADTGLNRLLIFLMSPIIGFGLWDLLWYAIAIWEGWRMGRLPRIDLQGPFAPTEPAPPLQFDTVQPAPPERRA